MQYKDKERDRIFRLMQAIIILPVVIDFVNSMVMKFFNATTSLLTLAFYGIMLCWITYVLLKSGLSRHVGIYILIICFFLISYLFADDTRSEYTKQSMILIYVYFLPVACLIIPRIKNWREFFLSLSKISCVAIMCAAVILISGASEVLNYMEFSYSLLPFVCILIYLYSETARPVYLIFYFAGLVEMIIFGARATIFFALLCITVVIIGRNNFRQKFSIFLIFTMGLSAVYVLWDSIVIKLQSLYQNTGSYFLEKLLNGKIFESETREDLSENIIYAINNMGFNIYGLFGDRQFSYPQPYAHNFLYEILLSFGWIIGLAIICYGTFLILSTFFKSNNQNKKILIVIALSYFARYFISGSFVQEYQFYYFAAILLSIRRNNRLNEKNYC